jgi:hypothetical protein
MFRNESLEFRVKLAVTRSVVFPPQSGERLLQLSRFFGERAPTRKFFVEQEIPHDRGI